MGWWRLMVLALLLGGCTQAGPAPQPANTATAGVAGGDAGGYPAPQASYPAPVAGYPAPTTQAGPKFTINEPVKTTDAQVTGTGPAGVPLRLVDVSQAGEVIASTTIGSDGTFRFDVAGKLTAGNRIGLVMGSTEGTGVNPSDFTSGPGYEDIPRIGILFAQARVQ